MASAAAVHVLRWHWELNALPTCISDITAARSVQYRYNTRDFLLVEGGTVIISWLWSHVQLQVITVNMVLWLEAGWSQQTPGHYTTSQNTMTGYLQFVIQMDEIISALSFIENLKFIIWDWDWEVYTM
jgi:hypothetical protein